MDPLIRMGLLYDFYGALLTPKQRSVIERHCLEDLSLGEIAEQEGSSRAAVYDMLQRAGDLLEQYESRLKLFDRYHARSKTLEEAAGLARAIHEAVIAAGLSNVADECSRLVQLLETVQED